MKQSARLSSRPPLIRLSGPPDGRVAWRICCLIGLAAGVAMLDGCMAARRAKPPTGPTVLALPREGEDFAVFQQHDAYCREFASTQTGGGSPQRAAARGAIAGAGLGAAAGALIGSASGHAGNGAAIGAGSGLLAGTLAGGGAGRRAAASLQQQYNISYTQCMVGNGERLAAGGARMMPAAPQPGHPTVIFVPPPSAPPLPPPPPPPGPPPPPPPQ